MERSEQRLILPIGLPCSGKSTFVWDYLMNHKLGGSVGVVNPDSVRLALGVVFERKLERTVWNIVHNMIDSMFISGYDNVVLDAMNINMVNRNDFVKKGYPVDFYYIRTSVEECKERLKTRLADGFHIPIGREYEETMKGIIDNMFNSLQLVTDQELGRHRNSNIYNVKVTGQKDHFSYKIEEASRAGRSLACSSCCIDKNDKALIAKNKS